MDWKKIGRFLRSMKFAIILLVILALACMGGSFITQGETYDWYAATYSKSLAGLIMALGLDDVFHAAWFVLLTLFLCLNLTACNLVRLPQLMQRWKAFMPERKAGKTGQTGAKLGKGEIAEKRLGEIAQSLGFRRMMQGKDSEGRTFHYSVKNRSGIWGAWVTHLGVLILIIGFGAGQSLSSQYTVYGLPGQSKQVGDTDYIMTIDDFRVDLREDDTVSQYEADLTVSSTKSGSRESMSVSVNHPAKAYGLKFYQNSMGWAATMHVLEDGKEVQTVDICQGEGAKVEAVEGLTIYLQGFYPNYVQGDNGMPATAGSKVENPGYLYRAVYNGQTQQMNVLHGEAETNEITVNETYTIYFDSPRYYTLIQVKRDPFEHVALVGGLLIMLGLLLSFYLQTQELWTVTDAYGEVTIYGESRKGGALFRDRFAQAAGRAGARILENNTNTEVKGEENHGK